MTESTVEIPTTRTAVLPNLDGRVFYGPDTIQGKIGAIIHPEKPVPEKTLAQKEYEAARDGVFYARKDTPPTFAQVYEFVNKGLEEVDKAIEAAPMGRLTNRGHITLDNIQTRFDMAANTLDSTGNNQESLAWVMQRGQEETIQEQVDNLGQTPYGGNPSIEKDTRSNATEIVERNAALAMQAVQKHLKK